MSQINRRHRRDLLGNAQNDRSPRRVNELTNLLTHRATESSRLKNRYYMFVFLFPPVARRATKRTTTSVEILRQRRVCVCFFAHMCAVRTDIMCCIVCWLRYSLTGALRWSLVLCLSVCRMMSWPALPTWYILCHIQHNSIWSSIQQINLEYSIIVSIIKKKKIKDLG